MKWLIVNADDFGISPGVNEGIIEAHRRGIVRSATLLANSGQFEDAVAKARQHPDLGIGCHLSLIGGPALAARELIPTLANEAGELPRSWGEFLMKLRRGIPHAQLVIEFQAQIHRLRASGLSVTHVDSHKHVHVLPPVREAAIEAARRFGIKAIRNPFDSLNLSYLLGGGRTWGAPSTSSQFILSTGIRLFSPAFRRAIRRAGMWSPHHFFGVAFTGGLHTVLLQSIIRRLPEGVSELMCHPGYFDKALGQERTRLKQQRERELRALTDAQLLPALRESRIELVNYQALATV